MKDNVKVFLLIALFFSLLEPDYFTSIKAIHSYYLIVRVVTFLIAIIYLFRKKQIPIVTIILITYYFVYALSTYINNGELIYLITSGLYVINYVIWLEIVLKNYTKKGLYSLNFVFSSFVYINLIFFLLFPEGYIQTISTNGGTVTRYFLGVYNQFASILIPAAVINVIYTYSRYGRLKLGSYLLLTAITFTFIYFWSATSIVGIILIIIYLVFIHKDILNSFINYKVILTSIAVLYISFLFLSFENIPLLSYIVEDLLGKDLTFSTRTVIWDEGIEMIKESFYLGYGYLTDGRYIVFSSGSERDAHNTILQFLLQHGILGFIPLILLIILFVKNTTKNSKNFLFKFILFSFGVSMLMMIAEVYSFTFILTIIMLGIFMPEITSYSKKELARNVHGK